MALKQERSTPTSLNLYIITSQTRHNPKAFKTFIQTLKLYAKVILRLKSTRDLLYLLLFCDQLSRTLFKVQAKTFKAFPTSSKNKMCWYQEKMCDDCDELIGRPKFLRRCKRLRWRHVHLNSPEKHPWGHRKSYIDGRFTEGGICESCQRERDQRQ